MKMYQVVEQGKGIRETYMMGFESEAELTHWLNGKRSMQDENKYSIVAWSMTADGHGWVDLERIWKLYSRKAA